VRGKGRGEVRYGRNNNDQLCPEGKKNRVKFEGVETPSVRSKEGWKRWERGERGGGTGGEKKLDGPAEGGGRELGDLNLQRS